MAQLLLFRIHTMLSWSLRDGLHFTEKSGRLRQCTHGLNQNLIKNYQGTQKYPRIGKSLFTRNPLLSIERQATPRNNAVRMGLEFTRRSLLNFGLGFSRRHPTVGTGITSFNPELFDVTKFNLALLSSVHTHGAIGARVNIETGGRFSPKTSCPTLNQRTA